MFVLNQGKYSVIRTFTVTLTAMTGLRYCFRAYTACLEARMSRCPRFDRWMRIVYGTLMGC